MPACGDMPDAIANAMASGRATRPTVMPAVRSETKTRRSYVRRHETSRGTRGSARGMAPVYMNISMLRLTRNAGAVTMAAACLAEGRDAYDGHHMSAVLLESCAFPH